MRRLQRFQFKNHYITKIFLLHLKGPKSECIYFSNGHDGSNFPFSNYLIFSCYSFKPNLTPRLLTSSSSSPKPQLCHQSGWNICSQTRHLFYCLTSSPKQKEWYVRLHDVMGISHQWYHLLQNSQGLTFIAILQVGGRIAGCRISLG